MRCPDCNKFVSNDAEQDPEIEVEVDEEGTVTGTCRITVNCADCGTELTETSFDIEVDLSEECKDHQPPVEDDDGKLVCKTCGESIDKSDGAEGYIHTTGPHANEVAPHEAMPADPIEHELEVEVRDESRTERSDGKPGTPSRYRRTFYGASCTLAVTCSCDPAFEVTSEWTDDIQASGMDSLT